MKVISVSDVCEDVKDCFLITEPVAASNSSGPASPVFLTSFSDVVGLSNPKLEVCDVFDFYLSELYCKCLSNVTSFKFAHKQLLIFF